MLETEKDFETGLQIIFIAGEQSYIYSTDRAVLDDFRSKH